MISDIWRPNEASVSELSLAEWAVKLLILQFWEKKVIQNLYLRYRFIIVVINNAWILVTLFQVLLSAWVGLWTRWGENWDRRRWKWVQNTNRIGQGSVRIWCMYRYEVFPLMSPPSLSNYSPQLWNIYSQGVWAYPRFGHMKSLTKSISRVISLPKLDSRDHI